MPVENQLNQGLTELKETLGRHKDGDEQSTKSLHA